METLTDPRGLVATFSYSGEHLASITDPAGRTTILTHDAAGNLIQIADPDGSTRQFAYDPRHRMTFHMSKEGGRHHLQLQRGRPKQSEACCS